MKTDIEIAREAEPRTIEKIATKLGISSEYLEYYGKFKCKVNLLINGEKLNELSEKDQRNTAKSLTAIEERTDGVLQFVNAYKQISFVVTTTSNPVPALVLVPPVPEHPVAPPVRLPLLDVALPLEASAEPASSALLLML